MESGLELAEKFYHDIVKNLVGEVPHAASLIGEGSEVLGYDQERSKDHAWGPRLQVFVESQHVDQVQDIIDRDLPSEYLGYSVKFYSWRAQSIRHHVEISTLEQWLNSHLRFANTSELTVVKWLTLPQQHLLQFTAGRVFHDDLGKLTETRKTLSWYPTDIWLWMMSSQWESIATTQHFLGRTTEISDLLGSHLNCFQLIRLIMELAFLQERCYHPYPKWFGTAFSRLQISNKLGPIIESVLQSSEPDVREDGVNRALWILAENHNGLGVTPIIAPAIDNYKVGINNAVRPYLVLNAGDYAKACLDAVSDTALRHLPTIGSIDQLTKITDLFVNFTSGPEKLETLYTTEAD